MSPEMKKNVLYFSRFALGIYMLFVSVTLALDKETTWKLVDKWVTCKYRKYHYYSVLYYLTLPLKLEHIC